MPITAQSVEGHGTTVTVQNVRLAIRDGDKPF